MDTFLYRYLVAENNWNKDQEDQVVKKKNIVLKQDKSWHSTVK